MKRSWIAAALLLCAPSGLHAWNGAPLIVDGVTSGPSEVAVAHDGEFGAFVAWQTAGATGELHATHLLADGSHDPAWPMGGIVLANGLTSRTGLRAIADRLGGAYLLWQEGANLYVTRLLVQGAVAPGWTARGRFLGVLTSAAHRPWAERDATGGIHVGWFQGVRTELVTPSVRTIHLGADGAGAGGWPNSARSVPLSPDHLECVFAASFAVAEDGGVWVLLATGRQEEQVVPGEWRLARFGPGGQLDPLFPPEGVVLGTFEADQLGLAPFVPRLGLAALVADGTGGVLTALGRVQSVDASTWRGHCDLQRRTATGEPYPGSPEYSLGNFSENASANGAFADFSATLGRDEGGAIILGVSFNPLHVGPVLAAVEVAVSGAPYAESAMELAGAGASMQMAQGGGALLASHDPLGPTHPVWDPYPARVGFGMTKGYAGQVEQTFSPAEVVFVDADATSLPDRGAILVWSRVSGSTGLFAQRVGANGSVLEVPAGSAAARALRLTRVAGGLRASWSAGAPGVLRLHDVQGRELARQEVGEAPGEVLLDPVGGTSPGILFAKLTRRDGTSQAARAVLLR